MPESDHWPKDALEGVSDGIAAKARTYLLGGKVKVVSALGNAAQFHVRGTGKTPYEVHNLGAIWTCSCPAQVSVCAHVLACSLVFTPEGDSDFGTGDTDLASIFDSIAADNMPPDEDYA